MIRNEREYRITKAQAERFRQTLAEFGAEKDSLVPPRLRQAQVDALRSQLADLEAELRQFESLRSGRRRVIRAQSLDELPRALIQTRLALGLSQRELAGRLGLKEQQIQRYEATEYASASLRRISEVIHALGVELAAEVTCRPGASVSEDRVVYRTAKSPQKPRNSKK